MRDLKRIPHSIEELLAGVDAEVEAIADAHWDAGFFLYLGRHVGLPVALEGALKLKEISYISTDAYAAGEMKHGPIALLDERTPVVTVATRSPVHDKVISNMQEVRARGAHVIAVGTEGDDELAAHAEQVLHVPATDWMLQPLLAVIPLQLLAYRIARRRGLNVDQPRNLAKTVDAIAGASPRDDATAGGYGRPVVGLDLLEIDRLERALERRPGLADRLFTEAERAYAAAQARPAQHLAARFCAKEAVTKALGLDVLRPRDIEVVATDGAPELALRGAVAERAAQLGVRVSVSLTHTRVTAGAVALAAP